MVDKQEEAVDSVSKAADLFSNDFHKKVASKVPGNFVSSALSAHNVLSMAAYGADGTTAEAMRKCLHLPDNDDQSLKGFQGFIDTINNVQDAVIKVANKIYVSAKTSLNDKFKTITGIHFRSESETLNFDRNVESAQVINSWCVKETAGKITEIVSPDDINSDTEVILLNAVYFKANWRKKFYEICTSPVPFHVDKSTTVDVPMMHYPRRKIYYGNVKAVNASCIAIPYASEGLYMVIIIPNEIDGLADVEKNYEKIQLDYKKFANERWEINLALPKFKVESTLELKDHLSELGLTEIFTEKANFSKICDKSIRVSKVVQKAFIEVNEDGCEAAAATGVEFELLCLTIAIDVVVDRAFIYKIVYKDTTLFSGHVVNPLLTQA